MFWHRYQWSNGIVRKVIDAAGFTATAPRYGQIRQVRNVNKEKRVRFAEGCFNMIYVRFRNCLKGGKMNCIKMFASDLPLLIFTDHFLYGTPCYIDSLGEYYNIVTQPDLLQLLRDMAKSGRWGMSIRKSEWGLLKHVLLMTTTSMMSFLPTNVLSSYTTYNKIVVYRLWWTATNPRLI
jgi:hypothetical protein